MLKCTGCDIRCLEKEGLEETPRGVSVADMICPFCSENLVAMKEMTVTEFIKGLLGTTRYQDWDRLIVPAALEWNRRAYRLPDAVVLSMYQTLKDTEVSLKANPMSRYA